MDNNCGVYLIISPSNGRYVGSSTNVMKRWNRYKNYSCSRQSAILASLKKYGYENHKFVFLFGCKREERLFWERIFGDMYLALADFPNGLNLTLPSYEEVPQVRSAEFRQRVSDIQKKRFEDAAQRLNTAVATKKGFTEEVKKKMSELHKKRYENPELCKHRSEVRKRFYKNNPEAREEVGARSKQLMERRPELRDKARDTFTKYYAEHPEARLRNEKKIINIETGEVLAGIRCILDKAGVTRKVMQNRLRGYSQNPTPYRYV
jgi:group I intron endonuclease